MIPGFYNVRKPSFLIIIFGNGNLGICKFITYLNLAG